MIIFIICQYIYAKYNIKLYFEKYSFILYLARLYIMTDFPYIYKPILKQKQYG